MSANTKNIISAIERADQSEAGLECNWPNCDCVLEETSETFDVDETEEAARRWLADTLTLNLYANSGSEIRTWAWAVLAANLDADDAEVFRDWFYETLTREVKQLLEEHEVREDRMAA